ncbi:MAG: membrane-bound lytic murein transglycosylase MltF [Gammaproteobacteria bacterium]|nr:membrane-bound lytic murein transglycosylase MltF [Gammaproteobacteria bacterium]
MRRIVWPILLLLSVPVVLQGCVNRTPMLEQVREEGKLTIVTRNSSTTYYLDPEGQPDGLEYELAEMFADHLGVELEVVVANNLKDIFTMVTRREVDLAAAGLTITNHRKNWVRFSEPIKWVSQQVIYRAGNDKPDSVEDLYDKHIEVVALSSHSEHLRKLHKQHPKLRWVENEQLESEELLDLVKNQLVDYVVVDSTELNINQHLYPELSVGFDLTKPEPIAWAFPHTHDTSLYDEANRFIKMIDDNGVLAQVLERHYSHVEQFDHVGTFTFLEHVAARLPEYEEAFQEAAAQNGLDWLLLAAMGYQESHWRADAVSPTGVRGLMMLTNRTARMLGVSNRRDPLESIDGGARYLRDLYERVPESVKEPDRMWMALASYNIGLGHLRDARKITKRRKGNPDKWVDVKDNLPLLRKRKWYRTTQYGYARGNEAVRYVENIRSYYEILHKHYSEQESPIRIEPLPTIEASAL